MALTRTEIELLIRARNDAQGAFDGLNKQITSITGGANQASDAMGKVATKTKDAGVAGQAAGVAFGMLAERLARGLVSGFQETIAAANRLDSGLIGLASTARAFGQDAGAAQAAAQKLSADGLMSVGEAAAGLKNLLAAGFGLDQATELMLRFKDSAAFGRQGALGFGQAIVGATEGIKNGNSALVDNAGVTKNLSNILVEAGFSAQDLSKATSDTNVRMALFKGILKETNPQLGDAAKYADTAAGGQARFNSQIEIAQAKIGQALQPALAGLLSALTPLVQVVGQNADTFVRLATIVATVVGPIAAMKAAAALGIGSLTGLGTAAATAGSLIGGVRSFGDARAAIQLLGESAGLTATKLGVLGTAAAVAGAAFIGWQVGKIIDDMTGLSGVVERATKAVTGWGDASQVAGAKQDVIDRAVRQGAASTITYAQAIEYNGRMEAIRAAQFDKSAGAQLKRIDAELALGRITLESANAQKAAIAAEDQAASIRQKRIALNDVLAGSEKKFRDEVAATGVPLKEILGLMKNNSEGFEAWSKQVGLSDETISRLKQSLKGHEEAQKKSAEAVKKHQEEQKKLNDELASRGVISAAQAAVEFAKFETVLKAAADIGVPALATAVRNIKPDFDALIQKAKDSGVAVDGLKTTFKNFEVQSSTVLKATQDWSNLLLTVPTAKINAEEQARLETVHKQIAAQNELNAAYQYFGITTPDALKKASDEATKNYAILVSGGQASTAQLKAAYQSMIDAQKKASGELPSIWQTDIFPKISGVIQNLSTAVNGEFAQMLIGATSFKDGFVDIWNSIKSSILNIFNSILSAFLNSFLKGILGAMAGQKGAFSSAFQGLFGGGGGVPGVGGGGGGLLSLLGLGGGGAAGAGGIAGVGGGAAGAGGLFSLAPGTLVGAGGTAGGVAGGGAAAGGAGGAGILGSAALGGLGAGAAGLGLGFLFQNLFGGAGWKAGAAGGASGAGAGALIGTMIFPGIGTGLGALIGGLSGVLGGFLGKDEEAKSVNPARDQFLAQFGGKRTGVGSGFGNLAGELAKLSTASGGGDGGGSLFAALAKADTMKEFEAAVRAITAALQGQEYATIKVREATDDLNQKRMDAIASGQAEDDVLAAQAQSYSALLATIQATGAQAPEYLQPILERLIELGLLVDANGQKVTDLAGVFPNVADAATDAGDAASSAYQEQITKAKEAASQAAVLSERLALLANKAAGIEGVGGAFDGLAGDLSDAVTEAKALAAELDGLGNFVPPALGGPAPGGSPVVIEGGAAEGVYARRPGLVLFGEGGEPEVGGPKSFFQDVFRELGVGQGGGQAGGYGGINIGPFNITAMSASDVKTTIERDVIPAIIDALRVNRRGGLTDMKTILGVS